MQSNKLPIYLEELNAFYEVERKKRDEFHAWLTPDVKAEFIQGEVVVHSPARNKHLDATLQLSVLLKTHTGMYDLGEIKMEKALVKLTRNSFEPDICFFGKQKSDAFTDEQLFFPAPDFVVEVLSDSTEGRDRGVKMTDYALHGVQEYWIVDVDREAVEQYILNKGTFELVPARGLITSFVVKGFSINEQDIFSKEANLAALQHIVAGKTKPNS